MTISIHVTSCFFLIEWFELRSEVFLQQLLVWKCLKSVMWLGSILFLNTLTMLTISQSHNLTMLTISQCLQSHNAYNLTMLTISQCLQSHNAYNLTMLTISQCLQSHNLTMLTVSQSHNLTMLTISQCLQSHNLTMLTISQCLQSHNAYNLTISHANRGRPVYRLFVLWYMCEFLQTKYSPSQQMYQLILGLQSQIHTFQTDFRPPDSLVWWTTLPTEAAWLPTQLAPAVYKFVMGVCAV